MSTAEEEIEIRFMDLESGSSTVPGKQKGHHDDRKDFNYVNMECESPTEDELYTLMNASSVLSPFLMESLVCLVSFITFATKEAEDRTYLVGMYQLFWFRVITCVMTITSLMTPKLGEGWESLYFRSLYAFSLIGVGFKAWVWKSVVFDGNVKTCGVVGVFLFFLMLENLRILLLYIGRFSPELGKTLNLRLAFLLNRSNKD